MSKLLEPLPDREHFFNDLSDEECSVSDFAHVNRVWRTFGMEKLEDLCREYVRTDTLLLACVFEAYRDECYRTYGLDPIHYCSAPGKHASYSPNWEIRVNLNESD